MIKEPIQKEDIAIVNIYAPNIGPPKHLKQIFSMDRLARQKTQ